MREVITLNSEELEEAIFPAEQHHVVLAEAMTIYHMPIYRQLSKVISSGRLGDLKSDSNELWQLVKNMI